MCVYNRDNWRGSFPWVSTETLQNQLSCSLLTLEIWKIEAEHLCLNITLNLDTGILTLESKKFGLDTWILEIVEDIPSDIEVEEGREEEASTGEKSNQPTRKPSLTMEAAK